jgi:hypothetical protein
VLITPCTVFEQKNSVEWCCEVGNLTRFHPSLSSFGNVSQACGCRIEHLHILQGRGTFSISSRTARKKRNLPQGWTIEKVTGGIYWRSLTRLWRPFHLTSIPTCRAKLSVLYLESNFDFAYASVSSCKVRRNQILPFLTLPTCFGGSYSLLWPVHDTLKYVTPLRRFR